jgi:hypothetical protein
MDCVQLVTLYGGQRLTGYYFPLGLSIWQSQRQQLSEEGRARECPWAEEGRTPKCPKADKAVPKGSFRKGGEDTEMIIGR